jgi:uracil phosphoribosyltransferase
MTNLHLLDHPLIQHKLSLIRDKKTDTKEFRELTGEISMLMAYEVTRNIPLKEVEIETPVAFAKVKIAAGRKIGLVPILRAGLGMLDGFSKLLPMAKIGHIGLYRDPETLKPTGYFCKLPIDVQEQEIIVLDPVVATGGSASEAIRFIKEKGVRNIKLMCLIISKQAIERLQTEYPELIIYCAAVDEELNEKGYIVPGLGDAGDRMFGTK